MFVRTGLAGAWRTDPGADWLSLRSTNLLPNKIDWFLRRSMQVDTVRDPATGALESTVTVTLENLAPPSGLPPYLIGNVDGFPYGTNHDALALYTPHGLESVTVDGVEAGGQTAQGYGGNVYTVPVVIPPEGRATVVFRLRGTVPTGPNYLLDVLNQPLAHDRPAHRHAPQSRLAGAVADLLRPVVEGRATHRHRQLRARTFAIFREMVDNHAEWRLL